MGFKWWLKLQEHEMPKFVEDKIIRYKNEPRKLDDKAHVSEICSCLRKSCILRLIPQDTLDIRTATAFRRGKSMEMEFLSEYDEQTHYETKYIVGHLDGTVRDEITNEIKLHFEFKDKAIGSNRGWSNFYVPQMAMYEHLSGKPLILIQHVCWDYYNGSDSWRFFTLDENEILDLMNDDWFNMMTLRAIKFLDYIKNKEIPDGLPFIGDEECAYCNFIATCKHGNQMINQLMYQSNLSSPKWKTMLIERMAGVKGITEYRRLFEKNEIFKDVEHIIENLNDVVANFISKKKM